MQTLQTNSDIPDDTAAVIKGKHRTGLSVVPDGYRVKKLAEVKNYLNHNMDLLGFLSSLPTSISKSKGVESIDLEFYHDIEEHWDKLFVVVNTQIEDMDELDALEDSLYSSLFEPKTEMLSDRVALSVG